MELVERTNQQLSFFQHVPRRVDTYAPYVVHYSQLSIRNFLFSNVYKCIKLLVGGG